MRKLNLAMAIIVLFSGLSANTGSAAAAAFSDPYGPAEHGVPPVLGGYTVLAVLTAENYGCLAIGEKRLILQGVDLTPQVATQNFRYDHVQQSISSGDLTELVGWGWEIVGPGTHRSDLVGQLEQTKHRHEADGCGAPTQLSGVAQTQSACPPLTSGRPAFTLIQNRDAKIYPDAKAQAVFLHAPVVGNKQQRHSAFLNNVMTDSGYFLQVGFIFVPDRQGEVVWSSTGRGCQQQSLNLSYTPGRPYWTTITLGAVNGVYTSGWWMCAADATNWSTYTCIYEATAPGTHLKDDPGTSVFVENWSSNQNWYHKFDPYFHAYGATVVRSADGILHPWTSETLLALDCKGNLKNTKNAIAGSLTNGLTASFALSEVHLGC